MKLSLMSVIMKSTVCVCVLRPLFHEGNSSQFPAVMFGETCESNFIRRGRRGLKLPHEAVALVLRGSAELLGPLISMLSW